MSLSKVILSVALVLSLAGAVHAQATKCPPYRGKSPLSSVELFDGPPEQRADLMPDVSKGSGDHGYASWDVSYIFDDGRSLFLVCRFGGTEDPKLVTVKVEKKVKRCIFQTHGKAKPAELICK